MASSVPPTVIIRDPRENPRKCTILPLKGHEDLIIVNYPLTRPLELSGYIQLAAEGPELQPDDARFGLLLLDGSWNRARKMMRAFEHIPKRTLRGYRTAYPRASKLGTDPAEGLATVEALYVAYRILGRPTAGLLDHYRWAAEFLRLNGF
ncbi:MAG: hypothetical protein KatS3mg105_1787 [Gemmatales bacterium]|nr:MAG: hypothetical protein KatS3mg105_1787 [Gemmatales bacterium]